MNGILAKTTGRSALAGLSLVLAALADPTVLPAQDSTTLPPAEAVPIDSAVDVSTLPPPSPAPERKPAKVKPFRAPDPQALQEGKDVLQRMPGALPPAPGFIEDAPSPR